MFLVVCFLIFELSRLLVVSLIILLLLPLQQTYSLARDLYEYSWEVTQSHNYFVSMRVQSRARQLRLCQREASACACVRGELTAKACHTKRSLTSCIVTLCFELGSVRRSHHAEPTGECSMMECDSET